MNHLIYNTSGCRLFSSHCDPGRVRCAEHTSPSTHLRMASAQYLRRHADPLYIVVDAEPTKNDNMQWSRLVGTLSFAQAKNKLFSRTSCVRIGQSTQHTHTDVNVLYNINYLFYLFFIFIFCIFITHSQLLPLLHTLSHSFSLSLIRTLHPDPLGRTNLW